MALIEEVQGLETEAKIEMPPSEVFETTGKEQQTLNLHNKLKKTKEADTSLSANLKISQGVAAAKRHLDHLFNVKYLKMFREDDLKKDSNFYCLRSQRKRW